ncbi:MAG: hypothetical protein U0457_00630 [Candidatus Sericytochromatia bacterium]
MSGTDFRTVNPTGTDIFDSLVVKRKPAQEQALPEVKEQTEIKPKDNVEVSKTKLDPKTRANLEIIANEPPKEQKEEVAALPDPVNGGVGRFKVENGKPVVDSEGNLVPDANGKRLYVKVDGEGSPIPGQDGNLQFVDYEPKVNSNQKDSGKLGPLAGEDGKPALYKVDAQGNPVFNDKGELQPDPKGGEVWIKVDTDGKPLLDEFNEPFFVNPKAMSKVPDQPINLTGDNTEPAAVSDSGKTEQIEGKASKAVVEGDNFPNYSPIVDQETNKLKKYLVDQDGIPFVDKNGDPIEDAQRGKPIFAKVDDEGNMVLDNKGKPVFVGYDVPGVKAQVIQEQVTSSHTAERAASRASWEFITKVPAGFVSRRLITGLVPGTFGRVAPYGVTKAVSTAVAKEVEKLMAKGATKGTVTIAKATENITAKATEGAIANLTKTGVLGKGIEPVKSLYQATKEGTVQLIKSSFKKVMGKSTEVAAETTAKATEKVVAETTAKVTAKTGSKTAAKVTEKVVAETTAKVTAKTGSKTAAKVTEKAVAEVTEKVAEKTFTEGYKLATQGAGEAILKPALEQSIEKGIKIGIRKAGKGAADKVITASGEKAIKVAAEKAAVEASTKGTAKVGLTVAKVTHHLGTAVNVGIMGYDTYDAYKKFKDPNVTTISKTLAVATVGLDGLSTYYHAKGVGGWKNWVATLGSMGTSIASDYFKYSDVKAPDNKAPEKK